MQIKMTFSVTNRRPNIFLLFLFATVSALINYRISFGLQNQIGAYASTFSPPDERQQKKRQGLDAMEHYSNSDAGIAITSLFNFTIPTIDPQTSGKLASQKRNGTKYKSPFKNQNNGVHWWTYSDMCFAVDNVCRMSHNRWFYAYNSTPTNSRRIWQPSFELKYMPQSYRKGAYADTRMQMNVLSFHRVSWSELEKINQCEMSSTPYHVVLQSLFNDMIGEFYSRTLMYLHKLLFIAPNAEKVLRTLNITDETWQDLDQQPIEKTQYYVHVTYSKKELLDAHKLLLSAMHQWNGTRPGWAKSAVDLLWPDGSDGCQCYKKLAFCGYDTYFEQNTYDTKLEPKYTLWPSKNVHTGDELEGNSPCNPVSPLFTIMPDQCQEYAELKSYVLANLEANYPNLEEAIAHHRKALLVEQNRINDNYNGDTKEWSIVGLTQRNSRRVWLNLPNVTDACNAKFYNQNVICIEVNVEDTTSPEEQFLLHRSLDALVGVHGAQLTQAILLPSRSHILELLPWIPEYIQGGWTARTSRPTPLGIIFHNTDLNHLGYSLNRSSVPLCQNERPEQDKECLTSYENKQKFAWGDRDFVVDINVVIQFVEKFVLSSTPSCLTMQMEKDFVLYNVWCNDNITEGHSTMNDTELHVRHFYRPKQSKPK